jgi:segregation and condensation protein B
LEAILFASGDSVSEEKLCSVLGTDIDTLTNIARSLSDYYDYNRRGIKLIKMDNRYQLCSRADYGREVRNVLETRRRPVLTQSALEVLAIIAYRQPVTKAYVEQVRGVDSDYTIGSLIDKGLIEACGRLDVPGRPILYKTTEVFLRSFGISSLDTLPELPDLKNEYAEQLSLDNNAEEEIK